MSFKNLLFLLIISFMASSLDGQTLSGARSIQRKKTEASPKHGKAVVCYVATWAEYRPDAGHFVLEDLQPSLCTHIVYSFVGLNADTNSIESIGPWQDLEDDGGRGGFRRLAAYKETYPDLKILMSIGGWNEGSTKYSKMASDRTRRATFVKSVLEFLAEHQFDGLDLHWKYPTMRGGEPYDKANFVLLAKELKEAFKPKNYILTVAVGALQSVIDASYDLLNLNRHVDFFHMMCYDYHGTWDGVVGANAPMKSAIDKDPFTVDYTIKYMLSRGVSPSKMILGLPVHGRTFQLKNPKTEVIEFGKTRAQNVGFQGPFTREAGFMGYNEICLEKMNGSWTQHWHEKSATPYLRNEGRFITFDNPRSIAIKVKTGLDYDLGGFMAWSVDTDDFRGKCPKETDAYSDFIERHKQVLDDPMLGQKFKKFNSDNKNLNLRSIAYVISDGKLDIRLPTVRLENYPIMQAINEAITLALEEKKVMDSFFNGIVFFKN